MTAAFAPALTAAIIALATLGVPAIASAGVDASEQQIYIDPDTGDVLSAPHAQDDAARPRPADGDSRRRGDNDKRRAWTNDEGTEMLTPAPGAAPSTQAVRCADGSLRMGEAAADDTQSADQRQRSALCDRPIR